MRIFEVRRGDDSTPHLTGTAEALEATLVTADRRLARAVAALSDIEVIAVV